MIGHQKPAGVNPLRAQPSHLRERRKRPPERVLGRRLRADAVGAAAWWPRRAPG